MTTTFLEAVSFQEGLDSSPEAPKKFLAQFKEGGSIMSVSVQTKSNILHLIEQRSQEIHAMGVRRLGLFGSFGRHEQNSESDVDLLVEFESGRKNYAAFMRLANLLEETLGRPVDLLTLESLSPHIGPKILSEVEYVALAQ